MEYIQFDRHISTILIARELTIVQKTVWNRLNKAGYKKKLDVWVLQELTQKSLMDRISTCKTLLTSNRIDKYLKRIITGDGKWVT